MEYSITEKRREEIWEVLSDAFVDTEPDYKWMAEQVSDIAPSELERIFFEEVALYCGGNMLVPAPPVWTGFAKEPLIKGIREKLEKNKTSPLAKIKNKLYVLFLRWIIKEAWIEFERYLKKNPS